MSEPLTAAGARVQLENNVAEAVESGIWDLAGWDDALDLLLASTAARAVGEALSVERLSKAMHEEDIECWPVNSECDATQHLYHAAALVAHLRGPRPEGGKP